MLSAKYDILVGCLTIDDIWAHGAIDWAGEKFACGVESDMNSSSEAWRECLLVGKFKSCVLGNASSGLWVVSLFP